MNSGPTLENDGQSGAKVPAIPQGIVEPAATGA
jgi:hypothetical protein